jgi:hypothetical protein
VLPLTVVDLGLEEVGAWLASRDLRVLIPFAVRTAIDEVIDGPRTGRWSEDQLEKTEKIYVGTKIEIVVRTALQLERTGKLDTVICGHTVDFKWSFTSQWEFPSEAIGEICLLVGGRATHSLMDVGLVRPVLDLLNPGQNKDGKRTLSKSGRSSIRWIEQSMALKPNFFASVDPRIRAQILSGRNGQERVRTLFTLLPRRPIPRLAIETVAQQKDSMRRIRADSNDRLGGMKILSALYESERLAELGFVNLTKDMFVAIPADELPTGSGRASRSFGRNRVKD